MYLLKNIDNPRSIEIGFYEQDGGYRMLRKAYEMEPSQIIEEIRDAKLRGRGGAGFPAAIKWATAAADPKTPHYLICNADEGEPGTFKDKPLLEKRPHLIIEGMAIAARAIGAEKGFIYLRCEYPQAEQILKDAIIEAEQRGYLGNDVLGSGRSFSIQVHLGAGAYICGEETALLESLEGKRGHPKIKPPYPANEGYKSLPTVVNNVETLCNVPLVLEMGAEAYRQTGTPDSAGPKLFCISGHVQRPGVYELPMGTPLRELIFEHAGGIRGGAALKGVIPGGISTPVMRPEKLDCPMDFGSLRDNGSMLGSGAVIVFDESTCMVKVALRTAAFFEHESCGKCSPCREGTGWLRAIFERIEHGKGRDGDLETINEVAGKISGKCYCPLGDAAANVARSFLSSYREEFEAHIVEGGCVLAEAMA